MTERPREATSRPSDRRAVVAAAVAGGLAVLLCVWLLGGFGEPGASEEGERASEDGGGEARSGLDSARGPRPTPRTVPPDEVVVRVVEREGGTPVEGLAVSFADGLPAPPAAVVRASTDAGGRLAFSGFAGGFLEIGDPAWALVDPADPETAPVRAPVAGGRETILEVTAREAPRVLLREERGRTALSGWQVGPLGAPEGVEPARTDAAGRATLPRTREGLAVVAAWDGGRRVHAFLLHPLPAPSRTESALDVPPAARTTRLRAVDVNRRPLSGATAWVADVSSRVGVPLDDHGEADFEYAPRETVPVVVARDGFAPRRLSLAGQAHMEVVLEALAPRAFRLRRADGAPAPDGTRLVGRARGPSSYGAAAGWFPIDVMAVAGVATVGGLPGGRFEADLEASGPDILTVAHVEAPEDGSTAVELTVGPPRSFALRLYRWGMGGAESPYEGPAWIEVGVSRVMDSSGRDDAGVAPGLTAFLGLDGLSGRARGREPPLAGSRLVVASGPLVRIDVPVASEDWCVAVGHPDVGYARVAIAPDRAGGEADALLATASRVRWIPAVAIRVEWADGAPASFASVRIRRDEPGAVPASFDADSTGIALARLGPGRYVVDGEGPDGARFVGDDALVVAADATAGPIVVRVRPVSR